ncbi:hypothetical protein [Streptomyces lancefieldiae]|uniref:Uncharacterized protein n=1 Tax=Streptomyces lancefieldiae TaxID=3075520 RepID=A0ABU3B0U3_9ACTN|nr:hypothetical protein [Streptomyces sp. DSM 40712]MDT0615798.1 hypothetical protein [Streptomyces sp. DSM 40712]
MLNSACVRPARSWHISQLPASDVESGSGLLLVEAPATHWGTTYGDPYTKTVWCEVALAGAAPTAGSR